MLERNHASNVVAYSSFDVWLFIYSSVHRSIQTPGHPSTDPSMHLSIHLSDASLSLFVVNVQMQAAPSTVADRTGSSAAIARVM